MIVYTPLDLTVQLPNHVAVLDYINKNYILNLKEHLGYTSRLCPIACPFPVSNWRDSKEVFTDQNLDNFVELHYVPGILELFPELTTIIDQLPYEKLYGMSFNLHTADLPAHHDTRIDSDPPELDRINVLVSPHYDQPSFFLQKDYNSNPVYPRILKDHPVYAFNDTAVLHGANPVLNNRIIIVFVGKLDKVRYKELTTRSIEKFKECVVEL